MQRNPIQTARSHPHLAAAAQRARQRWRQGQRLNRLREKPHFSFWELCTADQQLLQDFDSKKLFNDMLKANKEYHHGLGAPEEGLSIEQIAVIEYQLRDTTRVLETYFSSS